MERGFGSLSMFRDALTRARERGARKILYIGDFDPSGLMIEEVTARELGIEIERIAITYDQIRSFNPPSREVNMRDSRAKAYVKKYGHRCWEVEALDPSVLLSIVEDKLRENVPPEFLEEARVYERASNIAKRLTEVLLERLSKEAYGMVKLGFSDEEMTSRLSSKYKLEV
ncbi:MAG: hypothetical protein ACP5QI_03335 [Candidatus Bathyarchaeia archaeon]